jgi:hypothetical protein
MNNQYLFAIDENSEEIMVSESPKGSNQIIPVERIQRQDHQLLYSAVVTLTNITRSADIDPAIFKAMDKVCQMIYNRYRGQSL